MHCSPSPVQALPFCFAALLQQSSTPPQPSGCSPQVAPSSSQPSAMGPHSSSAQVFLQVPPSLSSPGVMIGSGPPVSPAAPASSSPGLFTVTPSGLVEMSGAPEQALTTTAIAIEPSSRVTN